MACNGKLRDLGREIQILVRDVKRDDAVGCEVSLIERDGFRGEQMQGDRVTREGIDSEYIEVLGGFARESAASVAICKTDLCSRVAEVGEEVLRDRADQWVDLVEADTVARMAVGG